VIDRGGALAWTASQENLCTLDESAIGAAASVSYINESGFLYILPEQWVRWVRILGQVTSPVIGVGGSTQFRWISDKNGTYTIAVDGTPVSSGSCIAGTPETASVYENDLTDNSENQIVVTVTSGSDQQSTVVTAIDDQIPPQFDSLNLTKVTGTVTDPTVTLVTVKVAGRLDVTAPVSGGNFTFTISPGTAEVTIEAINGSGQTYSKTVRIVQ
jgi:hypothetical protein